MKSAVIDAVVAPVPDLDPQLGSRYDVPGALGTATDDVPLFIVFEGVDGSGKTTQSQVLATTLGAVLTREPGATLLGAVLRREVLSPDVAEPPTARTEALVMAADRAQHVDLVIRPALRDGQSVVCDRYVGSTYAYQGYGRRMNLDELTTLNQFATGGLVPDLTVLIDLDPEIAQARRRDRDAAPDRIEAAGIEFQRRVRYGFLDLASGDPSWCVLSGLLDPEGLAVQVREVIVERFGPRYFR